MTTARVLSIAGLLAACGGGATPPPVTPPPPPPPPAVEAAPLTWMEGAYAGAAGNAGNGTLHVKASEGALYAVWLGNEQARVWIFDEEAAAEGAAPVLHAWSFRGIGKEPAESVLQVMSEGEKVAAFGGGGGGGAATPPLLLTVRRTTLGGVVI